MKKIVQIGFTEQATSVAANAAITNSYSISFKPYNIELKQDEDGRIVARCLDVQGAVSDGECESEALDNVLEAIRAIKQKSVQNESKP